MGRKDASPGPTREVRTFQPGDLVQAYHSNWTGFWGADQGRSATTKNTTTKSPANKSPQPKPKARPSKPNTKASENNAGSRNGAQVGKSSTPGADAEDKPKKILGGKRKAVAIADLKTGEVYPSKSKAGKALAAEFGLDPNDSFVWYKIVKKAPERYEER